MLKQVTVQPLDEFVAKPLNNIWMARSEIPYTLHDLPLIHQFDLELTHRRDNELFNCTVVQRSQELLIDKVEQWTGGVLQSSVQNALATKDNLDTLRVDQGSQSAKKAPSIFTIWLNQFIGLI